MQKRSLYRILLSSLAICQAVVTASNLSANNLSTGNLPPVLGIPEPPPNFDVEYEIGGAKLKVTACLMNTISALKELALGDWQAKVVDGTEYRLDDYPEVGIIISTLKRRQNIEARFLIWAITLGVYAMIEQKKFEFAQFEMTWDRKVIGWVHIVDHPPALGLTALGNAENNGTVGSEKRAIASRASSKTTNITNIVDASALDDTEESRLILDFANYGNTLSIFEIFVPIIIGLSDLATHPSTYTSPGMIVALLGNRAGICIFPALPERTSPPFLEYQWLIRTIVRIPYFMFQDHRFGEVKIILNVDGVRVGWGQISRVPCGPPAALPASSGTASS